MSRNVTHGSVADGVRDIRMSHAGLASIALSALAAVALCSGILSGCAKEGPTAGSSADMEVADEQLSEEEAAALAAEKAASEEAERQAARQKAIDDARARLDMTEDFRDSFVHGDKGAQFQKYIVLHDTEGEGSAASVVDWWDSNGNLVAAHFVINKDGSIIQCAPLDAIVHHAGYGDTGHNAAFGVEDESRDDMLGTVPIGDWAADYGMNSHSVGIEMVHVGGSGDYPAAQLEALDDLIAYIDAYYGFESEIIDHKAWRSGNSDTSPEFAGYFENYKVARTHGGA